MLLGFQHAHIHIPNMKSISQGSRLKFSHTHFQSSPGWQADCKSKCRFYDAVLSFLSELPSQLHIVTFLARQQIETCWGLKAQSAKL